MRKFICGFGLLVAVFLASGTAFAAQASVAPLFTKQHHRSLLPAAAPVPAPLKALISGTSEAAQNPPAEDIEPQETFGTIALSRLVDGFNQLWAELEGFGQDFSVLPELQAWFDQQHINPRLSAQWQAVGGGLVSVVGMSFLAALLLELVLFPVRRNLMLRKPLRMLGKVTAALALLGARLLPVLLFIGLSLALLDRGEYSRFTRFFVLNIVYALTLSRLVLLGWRFLLAPHTVALRFISESAPQARYAYRWLRIFSLIVVLGYFCIDLARAIHVPTMTITVFGDLLGLILVVQTIIIIVQKRVLVTSLLRGNLSSTQDLSLTESLRLWLARRWHVLAIAYLVIGYGIMALGVENGVALMMRGTILTFLVLVMMRFGFHAIHRWKADPKTPSGPHRFILQFFFRATIWVVAALAVTASWGADLRALFATPMGQRITASSLSIGTTVLVVTLLYGFVSSKIERHLNRRDADGKKLRTSARMQTLLPMIRNTMFVIFAAIVGLVVLSECGVNIAPLLAGAGVIGVAIGFGSQALIRDCITGLFIVLENTVAVGDLIRIGEYYGNVEAMSLRSIRLRDEDGTLHVLPFSELTRVSNLSRGFSFALMDIGVSYDVDVERVMDILKSVSEDLQKEPVFSRLIMEPIEILGVEKLGDFSITIRSRLRTRPGMQREVRRMFLLRLRQRFHKEGIRIPYPTSVSLKKEELA